MINLITSFINKIVFLRFFIFLRKFVSKRRNFVSSKLTLIYYWKGMVSIIGSFTVNGSKLLFFETKFSFLEAKLRWNKKNSKNSILIYILWFFFYLFVFSYFNYTCILIYLNYNNIEMLIKNFKFEFKLN